MASKKSVKKSNLVHLKEVKNSKRKIPITINPVTNLPVMLKCQTFIPESMNKELKRIGELNCICRSELIRIVVREWLAAFRDGKAEVKIEPMQKDGRTMTRVQLHLTNVILDELERLLKAWVKKTNYYIPADRLRAQLLRQMFLDWLSWEKHKMAASSIQLEP